MASKAALLVVVLVAVAAMGVGALVGSELGGPSSSATPSPTTTAAGGPGGSGQTGAGGTPTASSSSTSSPRPTVAPASFNRSAIEIAVHARVNEEREARGLQPLSRFDVAVEMARFHSENMAEQGFVAHAAGGYSTEERYKRYDIYDHCRLADDSQTGVREGRALEAVTRTVAGRSYERDGERRYHRTESAVADAVVDRWLDDEEARKRLFFGNAEKVGIGVVVDDDGGTYSTLDLC